MEEAQSGRLFWVELIPFSYSVVWGQCLKGRFAVDSSRTSPCLACCVVEFICDVLARLAKLKKAPPESLCKVWQVSGSKEDEDHSKDEHDLPSSKKASEWQHGRSV